MEHVKRLVLVPEHMVDQRKKPLVPPQATGPRNRFVPQVQEIDSDMQDIMQRQDIPIDAHVIFRLVFCILLFRAIYTWTLLL